MKIGDLVDFYTGAWVFAPANKRYANPGVVLSVEYSVPQHRRLSEVLWRDGRITREHNSFLHPTGKKKKNEV